MADDPESLEDAAATLLNGVMITLLGSAMPALFVWQLVRQWGAWSFDLSAAANHDLAPLALLSILSLQFLRSGIGLVRRGGSGLMRRRAALTRGD